MDIDGLGEKIVDLLVDAQLVNNYADLYRLDESQLLTLEGFGERKAQKLLAGIEASKTRGLARVLSAVSIRHVGKTVGKIIARNFRSLDELMDASVQALAALEEIGAIIAESLWGYLHSEVGQKTFSDLRDVGVSLESPLYDPDKAQVSTVLTGKSVVVTGTLVRYQREQIQELIAQLGGRASSSVSKKTDYLVAGEKAGSKLEKAQQLGVQILSELEFEQLIESGK